MADVEASAQRARPQSAPSDVVLQMVASLALTMLGEVLGESTTGKLLAGALGALVGSFLTARGSHYKRRIVAVALLLALLDGLKGAASALASTDTRDGDPGANSVDPKPGRPNWLPIHPMLTLVVAAAGFTVGTGATILANGFPGPTPTVEHVPDVLGRDTPKAVAILATHHFAAAIHRQTGGHGTEGVVLAQAPSAGQSKHRGSTVLLTVAGSSGAVVPNVIGLQLQQAIGRLGRDFATQVVRVASSKPTSQVLSQTPPAGKTALLGSVVSLTVSRYPQPISVNVPSVAGLSVEEADAKLKAVALSASTETDREPSETVASTLVIGSTPAAGAPVKRDSTVTLKVSTGPPTHLVQVPTVAGLSVNEADAKLTAAHLSPSPQTAREASETVAAGLVISSAPAASALVERDSTVVLNVSTGPSS